MRRLLCALLSLLSLLGGAAGAEEGRLWLHGDFESVETDGYRLQNGFYEYEKIAHKGDISLYAVGYEAESGYALLTPEEAGGDLTYERMEDADLGAAQAGRWRYTDAGRSIEVPKNYFPDDDERREPLVTWRAHAHLLYSNWLNYFVYQTTPYDISTIQ